MRDTMTARLTGKHGTETVSGFEVNGFFVHHPLSENAYEARQWNISHSQSGQSLLARFDRHKDALACAQELSEVYNGYCTASELIEQFKTRGDKPSVEQLARKHGM